MLTRDQILNAPDLPKEEIDVPEWGGSIFIRSLTAEEKDHFEASLYSGDENGKKRDRREAFRNIRARLVSLTVCDQDGKRIFTDGDIEALGKKNGKVMDRIWTAARKISGMNPEDVEVLSKNSETGRADSSASDSPGNLESGTSTG